MISRTSFYRLVRAGRLSPLKIGSRAFVTAEALSNFVATLEESGEVTTR
ncbi:MAG: helix-turn-helix domain-containing protein [Acidothermus sp.]|nr:helix-turn-helix domain-containing protein [Acidothermus sp.]